jgi:hypothetical protein
VGRVKSRTEQMLLPQGAVLAQQGTSHTLGSLRSACVTFVTQQLSLVDAQVDAAHLRGVGVGGGVRCGQLETWGVCTKLSVIVQLYVGSAVCWVLVAHVVSCAKPLLQIALAGDAQYDSSHCDTSLTPQ